MQEFVQDLRYAVRSLYKNPGFAAVSVLTLALGVGANTAIFSALQAVVLRDLPYREPDRVAVTRQRWPGRTRLLWTPGHRAARGPDVGGGRLQCRSDRSHHSHGLWQQRFATDPQIVGQTIQLDGNAVEVVGVMPPGFELPTADVHSGGRSGSDRTGS